MLNNDQIEHGLKGLLAQATLIATDMLPNIDIVTVIKVIVQIAVGFGTLYNMWKSRNDKKV